MAKKAETPLMMPWSDEHKCECVKRHAPKPLTVELHHIWPKYMGGPENGEKVALCGTAHNNVHHLLDTWAKQKKIVPIDTTQTAPYILKIALDGWHRALAGGWKP